MLRRTLSLIALALTVALLAAPAAADVVVLRDGRRIEGRVIEETAQKVRLRTSLGILEFDRSEVVSIERGKTRREEFEERRSAAETADDFHALGLWAEANKMRREARQCMERAVELDPGHAAAHTWLGNVEYRGEWMSPEERDRRMAADRDREMRERGFVRHGERWVTPEEKAKLEQGLVLHEGRWMSFEAAQRAKGYEEFEGRWIARSEALARADAAKVAEASGARFASLVNEEALVAGPFPPSFLEPIGAGLVTGRAWFDGLYGTAPGLELLGGRLAEFYVFGADNAPYFATVPLLASWTTTLPEGWSEAAKRVHGFLYWDPFPLSSARQWHRNEEDLAGHCYHHWGHLLLNRLGYDGKLLPPWYDEAFAALMENQVHGRNAVFCRASVEAGRGTSARGATFSFDPAILREGRWRDILRDALRANRVPAFDRLAQKEFSELELLDVAIGMGVLEWLASLPPAAGGGTASAGFHGVLREAAPELPHRVLHATHERVAAYDRAFAAAAGMSAREADAAWRKRFHPR